MSFWERQKTRAAMGVLRWHFTAKKQPLPDEAELERQAKALVSDAEAIARRTGKNFMSILKEVVKDLKK
jgi:hypothetical protein